MLPSPTSSSLGKYGETSVGMYTGIPQISIPIYSVKSNDIELPISLSYHAGGIKLEERASNTGIGWSLNAGGVITRSIHGLPDPHSSASYYQGLVPIAKRYPLEIVYKHVHDNGNALPTDVAQLDALANGTLDSQPDVYFFNFGRYSGSFFLAENGKFVVSPLQALKIESFTNVTYTIDDVAKWVLTTPDGVRYVFGVSQNNLRGALEKNMNGGLREAVTAWYLLDIISPTNNTITFEYDLQQYSYYTRTGEVINELLLETGIPTASLPHYDTKRVNNNMTQPRLAAINFSGGRITFTSTTNRSDLPGSYALDLISVFSSTNLTTALKKFSLIYDYSIGGRLTLKNFKEISPFAGDPDKVHSFSYNGSLIPLDPFSTTNNAQDLWGYYNGVSTNTVLPPTYTLSGSNGVIKNFIGADRHVSESNMKSGMLQTITYPTGGMTEFEFEANTIFSNTLTGGIPLQPTPRNVSFSYVTGETKTVNFTVANAENGVARVFISSHVQLAGCPVINGISPCNNAYIEGINGTVYNASLVGDEATYKDLPNGQYRYVGTGVPVAGTPPNNVFYLSLKWNEFPELTNPPAPTNLIIGGLRIKRITTKNNGGAVVNVKKYLYNKLSNVNSSSGVLVSYPVPFMTAYYYYSPPGFSQYRLYAQIHSFPLTPLTPTQGSTVGYENVTELQGENGENGKTEYTFSTAKDYPDDFQPYRPFPQNISYDFRRGKLLKETVYNFKNSIFKPVKESINVYKQGLNQSFGYGIVSENQAIVVNGASHSPVPSDYYATGTTLISEFGYLASQTIKDFDQDDLLSFVETKTDFTYDLIKGHYQLIKSVTTKSNGKTLENNYKYPADLTLSGTAETARQLMVANRIWDAVLQQTTLTNAVQTTQTNNNYKVFSNSFPLPESIETKTGSYAIDKRVEFMKYDNYGNILQQRKLNDNINFVIWDYNNAYPIGSVMSASSTRIDSMAYTSFEADGKGNWTFSGTPVADASSPTGKKCYYLGSPITKSGLSTSLTYIVSLWKKTGTVSVNGTSAVAGRTVRGWTYYEYKVVNPAGGLITVSGTAALIDELRLYPSDALMTTYTYKPLVGITSQCDPNNRITYFDYDNFNRLFLTRDQDYNTLKRFAYNYSGQVENSALVFNQTMSGNYVGACTGCMIGSVVAYTVPANVYLAPTLAGANQLTQDDINANGQAYANMMGACTTPGNPAINGSNGMTVSFTVQFHNNNSSCTPADYNFVINAGASNVNLGTVKEGNYNVTFSAGTNPSGYTYRVNGLTLHAVGGAISNVTISSSASNQVVISP